MCLFFQYQLSRSLLSKKNNNTIMVTTIQKLSAAIRAAQKESEAEGTNRFEKLRKEHIVFIVDEAHRAVSDEEMQHIKKELPQSTWFGLTGTPIFEQNQKQENGAYGRTTEQQYGPLLHAYTTKNAMDDEAVLGFSVEYHSLLTDGEQEELISRINDDVVPEEKLAQEALMTSEVYENDQHITALLHKIFDYQSFYKKFKFEKGMPTMSAILTTHSIKQAKAIYAKLQELRAEDKLFSGRPLKDHQPMLDTAFPRVAITFSSNPNQLDKNETDEVLAQIMADYALQFNSTPYQDEKLYNQNINKRLARKEKQYQKDGQWLDFVIVVDRLLTGFDSPTIQTLYVDREMNYQKLLQAFSRTNRIYPGKESGTIVTFRKPETMKAHVEETFVLFSNEKNTSSVLKPREYSVVREDFFTDRDNYQQAAQARAENPHDVKAIAAQVAAFQKLEKNAKALKSYDAYEEEEEAFKPMLEEFTQYRGEVENLKASLKELVDEDDAGIDWEDILSDIRFSSDLSANRLDQVDGYFINQLLKRLQSDDSESKAQFYREIEKKAPAIKAMYEGLGQQIEAEENEVDVVELKNEAIQAQITALLLDLSDTYGFKLDNLRMAEREYHADKPIPYLNQMMDEMNLDKARFEALTGEKYRRRTTVINEKLKSIFEIIQTWKEEL
ncbi:DEAD/DEAH box helicase family protein [Lactococcus sp.]|uniref:type I restriction enzyme subunit R domain-containing protein n=1 Tax=Lactococcus sp. TaxID=44273 RepID=UPI0035B1AAFE